MSRPTKIIIDLAAIQKNCHLAQSLAPNTKTVAVVKADAYGHGAAKVAQVLEPQVEMLTVSSLEEALVLREVGIKKPILLLEGCFETNEILLAAQNNCQLVVHTEQQISQLMEIFLATPLTIWLKIDSGMHRLGFEPQSLDRVYHRLEKCKNVDKIILISHFASADNLIGSHTPMQLKRYFDCAKPILLASPHKLDQSLANSAAVLAWPDSHLDWIRPGIMLFGVSPFTEAHAIADKLIPAMDFQSAVIAVREIEQGESVGYGNTWTAKRKSTIATIAVGYGDGYPRTARSGTPVLLNQQRATLVGRVSMDMITVDVTDLSPVKIGDTAILWGKDLAANEVASWSGTIGYELVTRMPNRVKKTYIN
jgi:alanine racemase